MQVYRPVVAGPPQQSPHRGTQFTCFTSTQVQILTQKTLLAAQLPSDLDSPQGLRQFTCFTSTKVQILTPEEAQLPPELDSLQGLRQLDARGNEIEHVPHSIFQRSSLLTLSLGNNKISALGGPAPVFAGARVGGLVKGAKGESLTFDDMKAGGDAWGGRG